MSRIAQLSSTPRDKSNAGELTISIRPELSNNGNSSLSPSPASAVKPNSTMQSPPNSQIPESSSSESSLDKKLVARVQRGDKKAFDLLVIKYQGRVASIVSRYIGDYHEIADVTQEAFIKAYKALPNFRGDSAFYTWIYRIAINCAKNYLIAKGRRPPAADIDMGEAEHTSLGSSLKDIASPEHMLNKERLEKTVKRAIANLPEDLRVALTLREFEGLSYDDIAKVMDCPVGTVRSRIFRAREFVDHEIKDVMEGV